MTSFLPYIIEEPNYLALYEQNSRSHFAHEGRRNENTFGDLYVIMEDDTEKIVYFGDRFSKLFYIYTLSHP